MHFGHWKNWNACITDMSTRGGYDEGVAEKVCGKLKAKFEKASDQKVPDIRDPSNKDYLRQKDGIGVFAPPIKKNVPKVPGCPKCEKEQALQGCNQIPDGDWTSRMKVKKDSKEHELKEGIKAEKEHAKTLESLGVPKEEVTAAEKKIAEDHLTEQPDYYARLEEMEAPDFWQNFKMKPLGFRNRDIHKADMDHTDSAVEEREIRNYRLNSKLSPTIKDTKEVKELDKGIKKEWMLNLQEMLDSDREFTGTFHKPVIDKENDIIPANAMDRAMNDFMTLPMLQEVHTERPVGIITRAWRTKDDEYKFSGKIKPGKDCDDVWDKIKRGVYDGLSIGGRRVKYSTQCTIPSSIRTTPCVTNALKLYNVSVCSSPVNPEATVDSVAKAEDELVFDITETLIKAESTELIQKGDTEMTETETVSKGDDELITKSDIAGLTKAVEDLNKSFEHYFRSLTEEQPQHISGKGHSVENTMHKGRGEEEEREGEKEERRGEKEVRRGIREEERGEKEEEKGEREERVHKSYDTLDEIEDMRKSFDDVISERDDYITKMEARLAKMEDQVIRKGGTAVVIPDQLGAEDAKYFTNTTLLGEAGRTAK